MCSYRPSVHCTFEVIQDCHNIVDDQRLRDACVAGSRDAHIGRVYFEPRSTEEVMYYNWGMESTFLTCPHSCT